MCIKFLGRLFMVPILAMGAVLAAPTALAVQDPPGCNANTLALTMNRSASSATPGEIVSFGVFVAVPEFDGAGTPGCNTQNVDVSGECPDGTPHVLATGQSYTASPPTPPTFVGSFDCVMPDVPVAQAVTAHSEADGLLLDTDFLPGSDFTRSNNITVTVIPCEVQVDKQVSCDGGQTWVDAGLVLNNEDNTNDCAALSDDPIMVRYEASNTAPGCDLSECVLTDSNGIFGGPTAVGPLPGGASTGLIDGPAGPQICEEAYGDPQNPNEPNTVTVDCLTPSLDPISASDTAGFTCLEVDLLVDRNVSCGGPSDDFDLVKANNDGTNGCTTLDGNPVNWEYRTCNQGTAPLYDCVLVDNNLTVSDPILVGDLGATPEGEDCTIGTHPATNNPVVCSDNLEASEAPDSGRVDLTCCTQNVADITACDIGDRVNVYDVSTVTCQTPAGLDVVKECIDSDGDGTDDQVSLTVSASAGDLGFTACTPSDTIWTDETICPADHNHSGASANVALTPDNPITVPFDLEPGDSQGFFGTLPVLTQNACNHGQVTCTAPDGSTATAAFDDECLFTGEGCLTRTPGFWGNRPVTTAQYLPLSICGMPIDNVDSGSDSSAIEAICSVGRDHRVYGSPQEAQLVRQCTAAALNLAVTAAEGGFCGTEITEAFAGCCGEVSTCTGDGSMSVNECIYVLDEFNNSFDTLDTDVFTGLGRAESRTCRESRNNGVVVDPTP